MRLYRKIFSIALRLEGARWRSLAKISAKLHGVSYASGAGLGLQVPLRINGLGSVVLGEKVSLGYHMAPRIGSGAVLLQPRTPESRITIGDNTSISNNVSILSVKSVALGERCLIGEMVSIMDSDFHHLDPEAQRAASVGGDSFVVGDNVWIGSSSKILKGSIIGNYSVIGAGSIVCGEIPSGVVAAGVPARVIKEI